MKPYSFKALAVGWTLAEKLLNMYCSILAVDPLRGPATYDAVCPVCAPVIGEKALPESFRIKALSSFVPSYRMFLGNM